MDVIDYGRNGSDFDKVSAERIDRDLGDQYGQRGSGIKSSLLAHVCTTFKLAAIGLVSKI